MKKLNILCIDDDNHELNLLIENLSEYSEYLEIIGCKDEEDAKVQLNELDGNSAYISIIFSDHVLPHLNGIKFFTDIENDSRFTNTKKVLISGSTTQKDTIKAINKAKISHYIWKPWDKEYLITTVKELLTHYLFDCGIEYHPYIDVLDHATLLQRTTL